MLEEQSLVYVNQIAEVLHTQIYFHYGIPNKNLGDTFLLLWKTTIDTNFSGNAESVIVNESHICDLAIYGCLKAIAKLNSYTHIRKYNQEPQL